jgi:hypothetical protein
MRTGPASLVCRAGTFPRRWWRTAGVAVVALAATGCGIRGTSVPVDAGAAPSRASCQVSGYRGPAEDSANTAPVEVFLVCGSQILPVNRTVLVPRQVLAKDRLRTARILLGELRARPTASEEEAGFSTEVPGALEVDGARARDPEGTLRLSKAPDELPSYALAQIVCTYAATALAGKDRSVVLGGPENDPPRRYVCTDSLRTRPNAAPPVGTPVDRP